MKVILNADIRSLGEEGDVKNVANGYYRNYLGPRRLAFPYNEVTVALFESRKSIIEARKEQKRKDSASLKERLEALALEVTLPAGRNGKLFGAVSAQTIIDLLAKEGFEIERKRIEIPGVSIKAVGNYHFTVRLYESQIAEMKISVKAQVDESAKGESKERKPRAKKGEAAETAGAEAQAEQAAESQAEQAEENQSEQSEQNAAVSEE